MLHTGIVLRLTRAVGSGPGRQGRSSSTVEESRRGHLATDLNWILRMAQLLRGAHKSADEIDILGAIVAHGERKHQI